MLYKCFMVFFTTLVFNLKNIRNIVKIGGGYVVKTYPSIDPHSTPPPPNKHAYKCQINSIACCDVIMSQHAPDLYYLAGTGMI